MAAAAQAGADDAGDPAWRAVRELENIQFAPIPPDPAKIVKPPELSPPPEWLLAIQRFLNDLFGPLARLLGDNWNGVEAALLLGAILGAGWIAWALLRPLWRRRKPATAEEAAEDDWVPHRREAMALIDEADRLAAEGRYGEAAHLLLRRSVGHIVTARPDWLSPSSTAREIGSAESLPPRARTAFSVIAREVERSLFALRGLAQEDWLRARAAYADFALADLGGRQ